MSDNVGIAGFSIKLNEEDQTENRLKEISKQFGYDWEDNFGWDDIMYSDSDYKRRWKPHMDIDGQYGFIFNTFYQYECYDIENYVKITDMGVALKDFIDKTKIIPKEVIQAFTIIYYNGSDNPFKF
jgi:hypothetical protein